LLEDCVRAAEVLPRVPEDFDADAALDPVAGLDFAALPLGPDFDFAFDPDFVLAGDLPLPGVGFCSVAPGATPRGSRHAIVTVAAIRNIRSPRKAKGQAGDLPSRTAAAYC